jgi:hypothetical protein
MASLKIKLIEISNQDRRKITWAIGTKPNQRRPADA